MLIKCTCVWQIDEWRGYYLVACDPECNNVGHRLMAGALGHDGPNEGDD